MIEHMNRIWEFTGETKDHQGTTLRRIRRISDGELGGWIEKETQVSDNAWVSGNACVYGNAKVYGNARVFGNAQVFGDARVYDNAQVFGYAQVYDNAQVFGNAQVFDDAWIYGNAQVSDNARVYGHAWVSDSARVYGNAWAYGSTCVSGDARVFGNAQIAKCNLIAVLMIGGAYSCTVTPQNVVIGRKLFSHDEIRKMSFEDAVANEINGKDFEDFKKILLVLMDRIERLSKDAR
jgi:carbonic anhydrase/acetyltransferase-like protein (isoleucine patch superfamily)